MYFCIDLNLDLKEPAPQQRIAHSHTKPQYNYKATNAIEKFQCFGKNFKKNSESIYFRFTAFRTEEDKTGFFKPYSLWHCYDIPKNVIKYIRTQNTFSSGIS